MNDKKINPTTVNEFFKWIETTVNPETELYRSAHNYLETERRLYENTSFEDCSPFLSVITRTQGKRPEMLTETLLCLTGQSNKNFELLVIGHNLNEEQNRIVTEIIDDMPQWMKKQTRLIPVNGGTRTTPLNAGFAAAKGRYIAILDDDDIVFDNWVEEFYRMYKETPGRVLHSYAIFQDWETIDGTTIPRAAQAPKNTFCKDFRLIDEIALNVCPPVCLAFPAYAFQEYGIHFDETLTTTEDWDYLMRVAFVTGVSNSPVTTCIYRNWLNAENSLTVHNQEEWNSNYEKIVNKFLDIPVVMPPGSLKRSVSVLTRGSKSLADISLSDVELYYDEGQGFSGSRTIPVSKYEGKDRHWMFQSSEIKDHPGITALRFDPYELGNIMVSGIEIRAVLSDGTAVDFDMSSVTSNGYEIDGKLVFLKTDPQLVVKFNEPVDIEELLVYYELEAGVPDSILDRILAPKHSFLYKALRFVWRKVKRRS